MPLDRLALFVLFITKARRIHTKHNPKNKMTVTTEIRRLLRSGFSISQTGALKTKNYLPCFGLLDKGLLHFLKKGLLVTNRIKYFTSSIS